MKFTDMAVGDEFVLVGNKWRILPGCTSSTIWKVISVWTICGGIEATAQNGTLATCLDNDIDLNNTYMKVPPLQMVPPQQFTAPSVAVYTALQY